MIGEQFSFHFLVFRYLMVLVAAVGLWATLRLQSQKLAVCTLALLGALTWLFTWLPLERPYGLQVGSPSSFELALVTGGSVTDTPFEGWVEGWRNPRPAWSLLWSVLSPGRPDQARRMYELVPLLTLVLLPVAVYMLFRSRPRDGTWEALTCAFAAVFASSVPLDAFQPFGMFCRSFFVSPYLAVGLLIVLGVLGLAWNGRGWRKFVAGVLLGIVGWLDLGLFAWGAISLLAVDVLNTVQVDKPLSGGSWRTVLLAGLLAMPQLLALHRSEVLFRGPSPEVFESLQIARWNVFAASSDMEWIFVFAVLSVPILWKRREPSDRGILSLLIASYALWVFAAATGFWRPLLEPGEVFHLLRFSVALAAGVGGFHVARWLIERLGSSGEGKHLDRIRGWLKNGTWGPAAFVVTVVFLLPTSALFLWHPLRMDALYYPSLRPINTSAERLERWVLANTSGHETILTGNDTGEWIAALTGRRVLTAVRVLPRDERRALNRKIRALLLSGDPVKMRRAWVALGATVLVLDPSLSEIYWQLDRTLLESSGLFRKVHQVGDVYVIYRAR